MIRSSLFVLALGLVVGCDNSSRKIVLPTAPFTERQQIAIANEDAAVCNCGCPFEATVSAGDH